MPERGWSLRRWLAVAGFAAARGLFGWFAVVVDTAALPGGDPKRLIVIVGRDRARAA